MKRFFSLILALVLVLCMLPGKAQAKKEVQEDDKHDLAISAA